MAFFLRTICFCAACVLDGFRQFPLKFGNQPRIICRIRNRKTKIGDVTCLYKTRPTLLMVQRKDIFTFCDLWQLVLSHCLLVSYVLGWRCVFMFRSGRVRFVGPTLLLSVLYVRTAISSFPLLLLSHVTTRKYHNASESHVISRSFTSIVQLDF